MARKGKHGRADFRRRSDSPRRNFPFAQKLLSADRLHNDFRIRLIFGRSLHLSYRAIDEQRRKKILIF